MFAIVLSMYWGWLLARQTNMRKGGRVVQAWRNVLLRGMSVEQLEGACAAASALGSVKAARLTLAFAFPVQPAGLSRHHPSADQNVWRQRGGARL